MKLSKFMVAAFGSLAIGSLLAFAGIPLGQVFIVVVIVYYGTLFLVLLSPGKDKPMTAEERAAWKKVLSKQ